MEINEYQKLAKSTAIYPNIGNNLLYPVFGLAGEVGELQDKIVKLIVKSEYRLLDKKSNIPPLVITEILRTNAELGLAQNRLKKLIRDHGIVIKDYFSSLSPEEKQQLIDELGDIGWYWALSSDELKVMLSDVAQRNITKLAERKAKNKIQGSGEKIEDRTIQDVILDELRKKTNDNK